MGGTDSKDTIKIEGIMSQGYGQLARFVMNDEELSLTAKGLYGYMCSMTGGGETSFPKRSTILNDLNISKTTYYSALKGLVDSGYISVEQIKSSDGRFMHNLYTIINKPKSYTEYLRKKMSDIDVCEDTIQMDNMYSYGYGNIPRSVMRTPDISIKAKALYAYLICYVSIGMTMFPSERDIEKHLSIHRESFEKYLHELLNHNVLSRHRAKGKRGSHYEYFISDSIEIKHHESSIKDIQNETIVVEDTSEDILKNTSGQNMSEFELNLRHNIHADSLVKKYDFSSVDNVVNIITDVFKSNKPIRINRLVIPHKDVCERLKQLSIDDVSYVLDTVTNKQGTLFNYNNYMLTMLYNSAGGRRGAVSHKT